MMDVMIPKMTGKWFDMGTEQFPHFVYCHNSRIIGMGAYHGNEANRIYVSPRLHRSGIGTRMVLFLEGQIRNAGFDNAFVHSYQSSAGFYFRQGYKIEGMYYYDYPNFSIPTIQMRKQISKV
jgi:GNAT superfamily N-acetyltransferase